MLVGLYTERASFPKAGLSPVAHEVDDCSVLYIEKLYSI